MFSAEFTYDTTSDIYGFQFRVTDVELLDVYGGGAEDAGFDVTIIGKDTTNYQIFGNVTGATAPAFADQ